MFVKHNKAMYKILKPILLRFLTSTGCKRLIVDLLSNKIDDMHDNMKEIFHRLKEVELAVAEIKTRR